METAAYRDRVTEIDVPLTSGEDAASTGALGRVRLRPGPVDIDDTIREVHGHAKQGAADGYSGVKGLDAQRAVLS